MTIILHLSDLHLGSKNPQQDIGDYKDALPLADREKRRTLLGHSLEALADHLGGKKLDAVIVSGDVTFGYDESGFRDLSVFLRQLNKSYPLRNDRVVVVPGNHDVKRGSIPGSSERYALFNKYVRNRNYVVPLCERPPRQATSRRYVLDTAGRWVIVPINSADFSQSRMTLGEMSEEEWAHLLEGVEDHVRDSLERLRLRDAARISEDHRLHLWQTLKDADSELRAKGHDPARVIRIAVLHHQLLPVTTAEEAAPYETMMNLGAVRDFLRENDFQVVLHGHKHAGFIYYDHVYDFESSQPHTPISARPLLVVSGATVETSSGHARGDVCRLIEIPDDPPHWPTIKIACVKGVGAGKPLKALHWSSYQIRGFKSLDSIDAGTLQEAYVRLLELCERATNGRSHNVVCRIRDASSARKLPEGYPLEDVNGDPDDWLRSQAEWWQRKETNLDDRAWYFNHGQRIYSSTGETTQFDEAARRLASARTENRSIVVLIDPTRDAGNRKFPALASVQFVLRTDGSDNSLDCVAYFRALHVRYWWPVNVAELELMQRRMVRALKKTQPARPGSLVTFAAVAFEGKGLPRVVLPTVDKWFDDDPDALWRMAYYPFLGTRSGRRQAAPLWDEVLDDLQRSREYDPDGVPVATEGIDFVCEHLERLARAHPGARAVALTTPLSRLRDLNFDYAAAWVTESPPSSERHEKWQERVAEAIDDIRRVLRDVL